MQVYKTEVLKCVAVPWIRMEEESVDGEEWKEIKEECRVTVQMLKDALGDAVDEVDKEVAELIKADKRLEELFC